VEDNVTVGFHQEIVRTAKEAATAAGFDLAGVVPVREQRLPETSAFVEWVEAGHAGEMAYMEKRTEAGELRRTSPKNGAPWVRSVVVCALKYNSGQPYSTNLNDPRRGWISRYAWGSKDYHDIVLPRLHHVEDALRSFATRNKIPIQTRSYVDTGPILERVYAKHAGLGWLAKNTCVINQKIGSWFFLGVVLTSLDLGNEPLADVPAADRCGSCTRCIDACPTQALVAPGKLDARLCIAYLTIEKRGEIPENMRSPIGHHIFGCDICQDVCPWNNKGGNAPTASLPDFQPRDGLFHPELQWLAEMDEAAYRDTFRGSPIKRAKFAGLKRNIAIAMGNSGNKEFVPLLETMAADADAVVAEHAQWALRKLEST
jgi:epoxyqueuosine reductase